MVQQVRVVATAEGLTQVQQRIGTFAVDASGAFCGVRWSTWEAMPTVLVRELLPDQMVISSQLDG
ncbi:MAG: hypothetical protein ACK528_13805 [Alphaproteobacteria bacterium]|jgi:hypothetical protein